MVIVQRKGQCFFLGERGEVTVEKVSKRRWLGSWAGIKLWNKEGEESLMFSRLCRHYTDPSFNLHSSLLEGFTQPILQWTNGSESKITDWPNDRSPHWWCLLRAKPAGMAVPRTLDKVPQQETHEGAVAVSYKGNTKHLDWSNSSRAGKTGVNGSKVRGNLLPTACVGGKSFPRCSQFSYNLCFENSNSFQPCWYIREQVEHNANFRISYAHICSLRNTRWMQKIASTLIMF